MGEAATQTRALVQAGKTCGIHCKCRLIMSRCAANDDNDDDDDKMDRKIALWYTCGAHTHTHTHVRVAYNDNEHAHKHTLPWLSSAPQTIVPLKRTSQRKAPQP